MQKPYILTEFFSLFFLIEYLNQGVERRISNSVISVRNLNLSHAAERTVRQFRQTFQKVVLVILTVDMPWKEPVEEMIWPETQMMDSVDRSIEQIKRG